MTSFAKKPRGREAKPQFGPVIGVDAARLERALGELALSVKTVQRMMVEKDVCTVAEFAEKLKQIDVEDGSADGRAPIL